MINIDKIMSTVAMPIIMMASVLVAFILISSSKSTSEQNNAYIRVINCIISIPATTRDQNDIETCYETVEEDLGVRLQRYDGSSIVKVIQ